MPTEILFGAGVAVLGLALLVHASWSARRITRHVNVARTSAGLPPLPLIVDWSEIAEILDQADWRQRSLDVAERTLIEVAERLTTPIQVRMHEPEKVWPVRVLLTERQRPGSMTIVNNVTLNEEGFVCHTQVGADRYGTPFRQVSALICYMLEFRLPAEMPTRVSNKVRAKLIENRGVWEAKVLIAVSQKAAKESLSGRATASEIAELLDKRFTIDPTHMSDEILVRSLQNLVEIIKRDFS